MAQMRTPARPTALGFGLAAFAVGAVSLLATCILPQEPSHSSLRFQLGADTIVVVIGARTPSGVSVVADGVPMDAARLRFEVEDTLVAGVDERGEVEARRRGVTTVRVTLVSATAGDVPPDTAFPLRVIVGSLVCRRMVDTLSVTLVDTLTAIRDTAWIRCGFRTVHGNSVPATDSAAIPLRFFRVSPADSVTAGATVTLDTLQGAVVALGNGTDTIGIEVDTSRVEMGVSVRQRAASLEIQPGSVRFAGLSDTVLLTVSAVDRRGTPIRDPAPTWDTDPPVEVIAADSGRAVATARDSTSKTVWVSARLDLAQDSIPTAVATGLLLPGSRIDSTVEGDTTSIPDSAYVWLMGAGADTTAWEVSDSLTAAWLRLIDFGGTGSGWVRWTRDPMGLTPADYVDTIMVTAPGLASGVIDTLRILSPVVLVPSADTVVVGEPVDFDAVGGIEPYTFSLLVNCSGATIDAGTGQYTAGPTALCMDSVRVEDAAVHADTAEVTVNPVLAITLSDTVVVVGDTVRFGATGGVPPYMFSLLVNNSGATIDAGTGEYVAGPTPGVDTVRVTDGGGRTADAQVTVTSGPAVTLAVTGASDPIMAGTASDVTVTALDEFENVATGYRGTITFGSSDTAATLPADYAFTEQDAGTRTFAGQVTLRTAGEQSVMATDTGDSTITGGQTGIMVEPGPVAAVVVTPAGASISGIGATQPFTVEARDSFGNQVDSPAAWESLNENVAAVAGVDATTGQATAVASGQVTISATVDGVAAYALLTVAITSDTDVNLWAPMTSGTTASLPATFGLSATDLYVPGEFDNVLRLVDGAWVTIATDAGFELGEPWGTRPSDLWVTGGEQVLHFDGMTWTPVSTGVDAQGNIWGSAPSDVFITGAPDLIRHYDGTQWNTVSTGMAVAIGDIWGVSRDMVLAVAGTDVLRFDGTSWTTIQVATDVSLQGVWGPSANDIYVVAAVGTGTEGRIYRSSDAGLTWSLLHSTSAGHLLAVRGTSSDEIYAVGNSGLILRFRGSTWDQVSSGTTTGLANVWTTTGGEVFVTGSDGLILRGVRGATVTVTAGIPVGPTVQLDAEARDAQNSVITTLTNTSYTWTSSDGAVASVDSSGSVTAVGPGTVTITATAPGGASGSADFNVDAVPSRIAFASDRDGNSEVYVMNDDGSNPVNLTNHSASDSKPAWAPDGERIAFTSDRDGSFEVYVMNTDGSGAVNLTNNSATDRTGAWSPDGTKIAFSSDRGGSFDIYVMDADGSNPVNITNSSREDADPAWSPNGAEIAFRGSGDIYVIDVATLDLRQLTADGITDDQPGWSTDGMQIGWTKGTDGIWVMNAQDGSNAMKLADGSDPWWSPDGTEITFVAGCSPGCEIFVMNADGTGSVNLTNNSADDQQPAWTLFSLVIVPVVP